jgi:hypothetical protein
LLADKNILFDFYKYNRLDSADLQIPAIKGVLFRSKGKIHLSGEWHNPKFVNKKYHAKGGCHYGNWSSKMV